MIIIQLFLLLAYALPFYFVFIPILNYVFFIVGLISAWILMLLDKKMLYRYYLEKDEQTGVIQLITRSLLFIAILIPFSLYVITSTGSALAIGLLLGIWVILLLEMCRFRAKIDFFNQYFLSDLKNKFDQRMINLSIIALTVFFVLIHLKLIL